ncbi:hypothetical protein HK102_000925 [Quaeritorhiza haematococci]|nr:hypothetical protein HK102_000925 [Quaeritorhiza haematococci]
MLRTADPSEGDANARGIRDDSDHQSERSTSSRSGRSRSSNSSTSSGSALKTTYEVRGGSQLPVPTNSGSSSASGLPPTYRIHKSLSVNTALARSALPPASTDENGSSEQSRLFLMELEILDLKKKLQDRDEDCVLAAKVGQHLLVEIERLKRQVMELEFENRGHIKRSNSVEQLRNIGNNFDVLSSSLKGVVGRLSRAGSRAGSPDLSRKDSSTPTSADPLSSAEPDEAVVPLHHPKPGPFSQLPNFNITSPSSRDPPADVFATPPRPPTHSQRGLLSHHFKRTPARASPAKRYVIAEPDVRNADELDQLLSARSDGADNSFGGGIDADMAAEIDNVLAANVRNLKQKLQYSESLREELQDKLKSTETELAQLRKQYDKRLANQGKMDERIWDLELMNQQLSDQVRSSEVQISRLHADVRNLQHENRILNEQNEQLRTIEQNLLSAQERLKGRLDNEINTSRRTISALQREKTEYIKKSEDLSREVDRLKMMTRRGANVSAGAVSNVGVGSNGNLVAPSTPSRRTVEVYIGTPTRQSTQTDNHYNECAFPVQETPWLPSASDPHTSSSESGVSGEPGPQRVSDILESAAFLNASLDSSSAFVESLSISLSHAQQEIATLQTKTDTLQLEKQELVKMLADAQETIETLQNVVQEKEKDEALMLSFDSSEDHSSDLAMRLNGDSFYRVDNEDSNMNVDGLDSLETLGQQLRAGEEDRLGTRMSEILVPEIFSESGALVVDSDVPRTELPDTPIGSPVKIAPTNVVENGSGRKRGVTGIETTATIDANKFLPSADILGGMMSETADVVGVYEDNEADADHFFPSKPVPRHQPLDLSAKLRQSPVRKDQAIVMRTPEVSPRKRDWDRMTFSPSKLTMSARRNLLWEFAHAKTSEAGKSTQYAEASVQTETFDEAAKDMASSFVESGDAQKPRIVKSSVEEDIVALEMDIFDSASRYKTRQQHLPWDSEIDDHRDADAHQYALTTTKTSIDGRAETQDNHEEIATSAESAPRPESDATFADFTGFSQYRRPSWISLEAIFRSVPSSPPEPGPDANHPVRRSVSESNFVASHIAKQTKRKYGVGEFNPREFVGLGRSDRNNSKSSIFADSSAPVDDKPSGIPHSSTVTSITAPSLSTTTPSMSLSPSASDPLLASSNTSATAVDPLSGTPTLMAISKSSSTGSGFGEIPSEMPLSVEDLIGSTYNSTIASKAPSVTDVPVGESLSGESLSGNMIVSDDAPSASEPLGINADPMEIPKSSSITTNLTDLSESSEVHAEKRSVADVVVATTAPAATASSTVETISKTSSSASSFMSTGAIADHSTGAEFKGIPVDKDVAAMILNKHNHSRRPSATDYVEPDRGKALPRRQSTLFAALPVESEDTSLDTNENAPPIVAALPPGPVEDALPPPKQGKTIKNKVSKMSLFTSSSKRATLRSKASKASLTAQDPKAPTRPPVDDMVFARPEDLMRALSESVREKGSTLRGSKSREFMLEGISSTSSVDPSVSVGVKTVSASSSQEQVHMLGRSVGAGPSEGGFVQQQSGEAQGGASADPGQRHPLPLMGGVGHASGIGSPVESLTHTMIGSWFLKFNRHGRHPQMRYFWVNPYSRTLYWASKPPNQGHIVNTRTAYISNIFWNPVLPAYRNAPPTAEHSLRIQTPNRTLVLVPTNWDDYTTWAEGLTLLLRKSVSTASKPAFQLVAMATGGDEEEDEVGEGAEGERRDGGGEGEDGSGESGAVRGAGGGGDAATTSSARDRSCNASEKLSLSHLEGDTHTIKSSKASVTSNKH